MDEFIGPTPPIGRLRKLVDEHARVVLNGDLAVHMVKNSSTDLHTFRILDSVLTWDSRAIRAAADTGNIHTLNQIANLWAFHGTSHKRRAGKKRLSERIFPLLRFSAWVQHTPFVHRWKDIIMASLSETGDHLVAQWLIDAGCEVDTSCCGIFLPNICFVCQRRGVEGLCEHDSQRVLDVLLLDHRVCVDVANIIVEFVTARGCDSLYSVSNPDPDTDTESESGTGSDTDTESESESESESDTESGYHTDYSW